MILRDLASTLPRVTVAGPLDVEIHAITATSREAASGVIFAAIRGTATDGHKFIDDALKAGAEVIVAESAPPVDFDPAKSWLHVPDSRAAVSSLASTLEGHPWRDLAMAGVTGTNGKTTTAFLIHHVMKTVWHRAGLLGTILVDDGETKEVAKHTTPGSIELSAVLTRMRDNGCRGAALEVSSHGIHQKRISAIGFDACVFTNLTQDHLDYHGTLEAYYNAKADWFHALAADSLGKKPVAVINLDDSYGAKLAASLDGRMPVVRYGFGVHCDFRANNFRQSPRGMEFELAAKGRTFLVRTPLIGRFNVYNILAAVAAASACDIRPRDAVAALAKAPQVPGRMENVGNAGGATVFVDYAHTPDALENVCRTLRELNPRRLITVFGCGGDRDRGKRPLMAAAAARLSDACIITSDNPRSEDPLAIIREVESGMGGKTYRSIPDRAEAIDFAIQAALSGDIILIAGKGHETTQQFADHTIDFDDRKHADKALRERARAISGNPMNLISAQQLADILGVPVAHGERGVMIYGGVTTDTRALPAGSAFFALRGENFNGDAFASAALAGGSAVAVVQSWDGVPRAGTSVIVVKDTLVALQRFALWWRKQLQMPVVGITGSNGKTSTKDFTAAVLSKRFHVSATRGNLNNHIGVPLTVLATNRDHTAAVWEMGMNHSGELAPLCEISRPKYGIITNIGTAHIEFLGSREAIAEEKGTLARALPADGILFLPATCEFHDYLRRRTNATIIAVGNGRGLVRAENLSFEAEGTRFTLVIEGAERADLFLPVPGRHMVTNALLAAGVGWKLGLPTAEIADGLSTATLTSGRLRRFEHEGVTIIDDTYNANPESMAAAIDTLADTPVSPGARRIIVLGRMGELGPHAPAAHLRTGELAAARKLTVVAVGEGAEGIAKGAIGASYFPDLADAGQWLAAEVKPGDVVLFKGSRSATVERVMHTAFPR